MNRAAIIAAFADNERGDIWNGLFMKLQGASTRQERELGLTYKESLKDANFARNRYQNVFPWDQTRVSLKLVDCGQTDYLNASALEVPFAQRKYILTQGPLDGTAADFWQMVWEQNVEIIAMLNNVIEKGSQKCYPYFVDLDEKHKTFGNWSVSLEDEYGTEDYRIRKVKLTALDKKFFNDGSADRTISHFHYTNWPDFGVPDTKSFLEYLEEVNRTQESTSPDAPVVVHCSAGIGRSGAYVVVDCVLKYLQAVDQVTSKEGGEVADLPKTIEDFVLFIRRHRMGLIQTSEQLRFCYQAIVDWINAHPEVTNGDSHPEPLEVSETNGEPHINGDSHTTSEPDSGPPPTAAARPISPTRKRHSTSTSDSSSLDKSLESKKSKK